MTMASRNHGDGNQGRQIQFLRSGGGDDVKCVVKLLDGSQLSIPMKRSSKGSDLMSRIGKFLHLTDAECFSCTFSDCSTSSQVWLKADKKLTKQLKNNLPIFNFRVKFYPPDHSELKDQIARLLLFQQVRKDIYEERIPCSFVTHALLLSLCVQSDHGDWDHCRTPKSRDRKVVSVREFREDIDDIFNRLEIPMSFERVKSELQEKIYELYRGHKGLPKDEAINNFLDNARKLAKYGMHNVLAEDVDGDVVEVSVSSEGIMVHRDGLRIARFLWPRLIKIAYRKNKFILEDRSLNDKRKTIVFRFSMPKESKRFWRLCVEHHAFFRLGNRARTLPRSIETRSSNKTNNVVPDASSCVVVVYDDTKSRSKNWDKRKLLSREKATHYSNRSPVCNGPQEIRKYPQHNFKPSPCNFSDTRTSCQSSGDNCQRHKCDHPSTLKNNLQGTIIKCFRSYEGNLNLNPGTKDQNNASRRPESCTRLPCGCPNSINNNNDKRFTNRSIDFNISGSVSIEEGGPSCFDNQTYNRLQQTVVRSSSLTNNNQNCSADEGRHVEAEMRKKPVELKHRHSLVGVENIKPVCIIEASERPRLSSIDGKKILSRYDPSSHRTEATQQCNERCGLSCLQGQQKNLKPQKPNQFATYDNIDPYVCKNEGAARLLPTTPDVLPQVLVSEDIVRLHERDQISPTPLQLSTPLLSTTFPPSPVLNVTSYRVPSTTSPLNATSKCRHHDMWDQFESYPMDVVSLPPSPKKPPSLSFPNSLLTTVARGSSHSPQMPIIQLPKRINAPKALEYRPLTQSSENPASVQPYYINVNSHSMTNLRLHSPSSPTSHVPSFPCHTLPDRDANVFSRGLASLPRFEGHHFALPPPPTSSPDLDDPVYSTVNKPKRIFHGSSEHALSPTIHKQSSKPKVPPPVPPKRDLKNSLTTKNVVITAYMDPTKTNNEQQGLYDNYQPSSNHNPDQSFKTFRGRSKSVDDEAEGYYDNLMSEPLGTVDDSTFKSSSSSSSSSTSSLSSVVHRRASVGSSFVTFDTPDGYRITEVRRADDNTVIETMVEKTLVIQGRNFVDQDKAIADAISSLSKINPGLSVEEIKINTVRQ